jgi:hypothetical protein
VSLVIGPYPFPGISPRGEEGFSSCSACPCHHAIATTPPEWDSRLSQLPTAHAAFAPRLRARPPGLRTFGATSAFACAMAWWLASIPQMVLSIGFRASVSLRPAIQATGLLTFAPAGLTPAEHASLSWTHNRTCGSPASGSPVGGSPPRGLTGFCKGCD